MCMARTSYWDESYTLVYSTYGWRVASSTLHICSLPALAPVPYLLPVCPALFEPARACTLERTLCVHIVMQMFSNFVIAGTLLWHDRHAILAARSLQAPECLTLFPPAHANTVWVDVRMACMPKRCRPQAGNERKHIQLSPMKADTVSCQYFFLQTWLCYDCLVLFVITPSLSHYRC